MRVTLGKIAGVHGVRGWLKVLSYTEPRENLLNYPRWILNGNGLAELVTAPVTSRTHGSGFIVQLKDERGAPVADRDLARQYVGALIQIERADMPALPAGQVYWADLIGLEVESTGGAALGRVERVLDNGAQAVLQLRARERGRAVERLIPFVSGPIVKALDLQSGRIVVDWSPEW